MRYTLPFVKWYDMYRSDVSDILKAIRQTNLSGQCQMLFGRNKFKDETATSEQKCSLVRETILDIAKQHDLLVDCTVDTYRKAGNGYIAHLRRLEAEDFATPNDLAANNGDADVVHEIDPDSEIIEVDQDGIEMAGKGASIDIEIDISDLDIEDATDPERKMPLLRVV